MPGSNFELSLEDALRALAHATRRQLLLRLMGPEPDPVISVPEALHVDEVGYEERYTAFLHQHFPLLEELELIVWDRETRILSRGVNFGKIRPLLNLIDDFQDDVPDDQVQPP